MPWFAWVLAALIAVNIPVQAYLVDRPRKPKSMGDALISCVELAFWLWIVVELGTHYVA